MQSRKGEERPCRVSLLVGSKAGENIAPSHFFEKVEEKGGKGKKRLGGKGEGRATRI